MHPRTLPGLLLMRQSRDAGRRLFVSDDASWTVADTVRVAGRQARALAEAGIGRGDPVAIVCGNHAGLMRVFLGCAWSGAIAVPINTACRGPQLRYYLENSGARLLAIDAAFAPELAAAMAEDASALAALERVWVFGAAGLEPGIVAALQARWPTHEADDCAGAPERGADAGADTTALEPVALAAPAALGPGDTLAILYTSGTTGPSKGVCCPHAHLLAWGENSARLLGVREGDVLCTTLPLFHVNALNCFVQALTAGATQVVEPRFSASGFWSTMARVDATVGYLLGAMVPMLLAQPPSPAERGHRLRIALAPGVPASLHAAFRQRTGVVLLEGYGSTETNFVIAAEPGSSAEGTMGTLQPGFSARVADEHDEPLPDGVAGELLLRAEQPFAFANGYWGLPGATVEAWRNLWFHTGDRVVRDAQGRFRFVDRLKDAIRRRGENISSYEVEQVLLSHASVAAAAVFPVRSELAEDEVIAALIPREAQTIDPVAIIRHCETRLPHFAVPRFLEVVAELPRTENGKVRKVVLRERGIGRDTWDREAAGIVVARRR